MISELKNRKSLTFYDTSRFQPSGALTTAYSGGITSVSLSAVGYSTVNTTNEFNNQLNNYLTNLQSKQDAITKKVTDILKDSPDYKGSRNSGVDLAWDYEKADVEMGGKGSANWNKEQREEIKNSGKVRGAEGHHQKNVSDHPEEQGNADNIKFYKSRQEHLKKGHDGNFKNESDEPLIDKTKMLKKTNGRRVIKNEIRGLGIAAAIGAGVGFTIGFTVTLAQSGITPESIKFALAEGGKSGLSSGVQSVVSYGIGRTIGQLAVSAVEGWLPNIGISVTENIAKMCNMGVIGSITIIAFSVYQFFKLTHNGATVKEAAIAVRDQALFSLSLLAISILVQGIWGGPAGMIVSLSFGIVTVTTSVVSSIHQREEFERIRCYIIEKSKPVFI